MSFWSKLKVALTGPKPKPFKLLPKKEGPTVADQLDILCHKLGCTYERDMAGQQVRLCLLFSNGEKLCGQGNTTADAFAALHKRAKRANDL